MIGRSIGRPIARPVGRGVVRNIGVLYDPAAMDFFARLPANPSSLRRKLVNDLVVQAKDTGCWTPLIALHLMAFGLDDPGYTTANDAVASNQNLLQATNTLLPVSAPAFQTDRGRTGDGSSSSMNAQYNPATAGGIFTQNSAHLGIWERTNLNTLTAAIGTNGAVIVPRSNTDGLVHRVNVASSATVAGMVDSRGHTVSSRTASNLTTPYKNGIALATAADASVAMVSESIHYLSRAGTSIWRGSQVAVGHFGAGLIGAQVAALYAAISTYLTAIGAA